MVDNFSLIRSFLWFSITGEDFYFLQIIKRRKDNPGLSKSEKLIRNFYIYSLLDFDNLKPKIIELCNENNARAYFRLNKRNSKQIALQTSKRIIDLIINENYRAIENVFPSICGEYCSGDKTWIIDVDDEYNFNKFFNIQELFNKEHKYSQIELKGIIPTKNGKHIITKPFDINLFNKLWGENKPDIHKDNPTILYQP